MRPILLFLVFALISCSKEGKKPPIDHSLDLDGNQINDSALSVPQRFLQSRALTHFPDEDVFIAVHGFSASTFEWLEFASFCSGKRDVHVSRVLLGGHGRDYEDFAKATWEEWQEPIIREYNALREIGYKKIHFIAASTGCPLVLDLLASDAFPKEMIGHVFLIDPIIVPSNKQLSLAPALAGTVIHYTETELSPAETGRWYRYRPAFALKQLDVLTRRMRKKLQKGMSMPAHISFHVLKSEKDGSADPVSAVIIDKGLDRCETKMIASDLHVFTRLAGRENVTDADRDLQLRTFEEIYSDVKKR